MAVSTSTRIPPKTRKNSLPLAIPDSSPSPESALPAQRRELPTHDEIAARAYAISQRRCAEGCAGDEMSDWLQAEAELVAQSS